MREFLVLTELGADGKPCDIVLPTRLILAGGRRVARGCTELVLEGQTASVFVIETPREICDQIDGSIESR